MGKISRLQHGSRHRSTTVFVEFRNKNRRRVEFNIDSIGGDAFASTFYHVGDSVPILYNPKNPKDATIATWDMMWLPPVLVTLLGVLIFSLGFK